MLSMSLYLQACMNPCWECLQWLHHCGIVVHNGCRVETAAAKVALKKPVGAAVTTAAEKVAVAVAVAVAEKSAIDVAVAPGHPLEQLVHREKDTVALCGNMGKEPETGDKLLELNQDTTLVRPLSRQLGTGATSGAAVCLCPKRQSRR